MNILPTPQQIAQQVRTRHLEQQDVKLRFQRLVGRLRTIRTQIDTARPVNTDPDLQATLQALEDLIAAADASFDELAPKIPALKKEVEDWSAELDTFTPRLQAMVDNLSASDLSAAVSKINPELLFRLHRIMMSHDDARLQDVSAAHRMMLTMSDDSPRPTGGGSTTTGSSSRHSTPSSTAFEDVELIRQLRAEVKSETDRVAKLEADLQRSKNETAAAQEGWRVEKAQLQDLCDRRKSSLDEQSDEVETLRAQIASDADEIEQLKTKLSERLASQDLDNDGLTLQLVEAEAESTRLFNELEEARGLQTELTTSKSAVENLEARVVDLQKQLDDAADRQTALQGLCDSYESTRPALEAERARLDGENTALRRDKETAKQSRRDNVLELTDIKLDAQRIQGELDEATRERGEVVKQRDEALKQRDEAVKARDEAVRQRDEAVRQRYDASKLRDEAVAQHKVADEQCKEATKKLNEAEGKINVLSQGKHGLEQALALSASALGEEKASTASLSADKERLDGELLAEKLSVAQLTAAKENLQASLQTEKDSVARLSKAKENLEAELLTEKSSVAGLTTTKANLQASLQAEKASVATLSRTKEGLEADLRREKSSAADLTASVEQLTTANSRLQTEKEAVSTANEKLQADLETAQASNAGLESSVEQGQALMVGLWAAMAPYPPVELTFWSSFAATIATAPSIAPEGNDDAQPAPPAWLVLPTPPATDRDCLDQPVPLTLDGLALILSGAIETGQAGSDAAMRCLASLTRRLGAASALPLKVDIFGTLLSHVVAQLPQRLCQEEPPTMSAMVVLAWWQVALLLDAKWPAQQLVQTAKEALASWLARDPAAEALTRAISTGGDIPTHLGDHAKTFARPPSGKVTLLASATWRELVLVDADRRHLRVIPPLSISSLLLTEVTLAVPNGEEVIFEKDIEGTRWCGRHGVFGLIRIKRELLKSLS